MNKNPTFKDYVNECMQDIFDGLISGGTKEMKSRLHQAISQAAWIAQNGGFNQE